MLLKETLTSENLKKSFHDNFELALFVINVARHLVRSGREVSVPSLIKEIQRNPTHYTEERLETLRQEMEAVEENA